MRIRHLLICGFRRFVRLLLPASFLVVGVVGCKSRPAAPEQGVFLKQNVHVMDTRRRGGYRYLASYLNYTAPGKGHMIIPVNTEIVFGRARGGFMFRMVGERQPIVFEYHPRRTGMSMRTYQDIITSSEPISLDGFSDLDLQGISEGKPYIGMTREAIRIALGYPSPHTTKSLDATRYVYWKNRRQQLIIEFDANGKVNNIR